MRKMRAKDLQRVNLLFLTALSVLIPVVIAAALDRNRSAEDLGEIRGQLKMLDPERNEHWKKSFQRELEDRRKAGEEIDSELVELREGIRELQQVQAESEARLRSALSQVQRDQQQLLLRWDQRNSVHRLPPGTVVPSVIPPSAFLSEGRERAWRLANGDYVPRQTEYAQLMAGARGGGNDVRLPNLQGMVLRGHPLYYYVRVR